MKQENLPYPSPPPKKNKRSAYLSAALCRSARRKRNSAVQHQLLKLEHLKVTGALFEARQRPVASLLGNVTPHLRSN